MVIEREVAVQPVIGIIQCIVIVGIDLFILDGSPQSFHKDIVMGASPTIHADTDTCPRQTVDECDAGELCPLIRVEDQRLTNPQRVLQAIQAKPGFQSIGQPPSQHLAAIPVQDRYQVHKAGAQPQVRNVGAPHLIRVGDRDPA